MPSFRCRLARLRSTALPSQSSGKNLVPATRGPGCSSPPTAGASLESGDKTLATMAASASVAVRRSRSRCDRANGVREGALHLRSSPMSDGRARRGSDPAETSRSMVFRTRFPSRQAWRRRMAGFPGSRKWELQNAFCAANVKSTDRAGSPAEGIGQILCSVKELQDKSPCEGLIGAGPLGSRSAPAAPGWRAVPLPGGNEQPGVEDRRDAPCRTAEDKQVPMRPGPSLSSRAALVASSRSQEVTFSAGSRMTSATLPAHGR